MAGTAIWDEEYEEPQQLARGSTLMSCPQLTENTKEHVSL